MSVMLIYVADQLQMSKVNWVYAREIPQRTYKTALEFLARRSHAQLLKTDIGDMK
jgi:hypothetical protein